MRLSPIQSRCLTIFNNDTDNRDKLSDVNIEIEGKRCIRCNSRYAQMPQLSTINSVKQQIQTHR
jgi:uncharacterized protein with PIN domain